MATDAPCNTLHSRKKIRNPHPLSSREVLLESTVYPRDRVPRGYSGAGRERAVPWRVFTVPRGKLRLGPV